MTADTEPAYELTWPCPSRPKTGSIHPSDGLSPNAAKKGTFPIIQPMSESWVASDSVTFGPNPARELAGSFKQ